MADQQTYNYTVVRQFAIMTIVWGIVGMLVGVIVAAQLAFPDLFLWDGIQWLSYGRLRPLHTNAAIFAFVGNMMFAGIYYWWPKVFGKMLNESWGRANFWFMIIGMNLTFGPMHIIGLQGQPRRMYVWTENRAGEGVFERSTRAFRIRVTCDPTFCRRQVLPSPMDDAAAIAHDDPASARLEHHADARHSRGACAADG